MKLVVFVLALAATASAHHSLEKTYDLQTEVALEGRIRQVLLRNPHSFLQLEVADSNGASHLWSVEFPKGLKALHKQGIQAGTLQTGDRVNVILNPSFKPGDNRGALVELRRTSDGLQWNAKSKKQS